MIQDGLHSMSVDGGQAESPPASQVGTGGETSTSLEDQDCQSGTMEAVERLPAGMADDFNNLLMVIAGYNDVLLGLKELPLDGRRSALEIKHAAERAFAVTRQLLSFSRRDTAQPKLVALVPLVEGMAPMLRRLLGEDIALEMVVTRNVPWVKADPVQLEWMLINLAANARDAMPDGGRLRIEVQGVIRDIEAVARVIVADTGRGVDATTRAHLFEPFFTSKGPGQGSGFRLATVYGVVTQNHGTIRVSSEVGPGTSFTIDLPGATEPDEQAIRTVIPSISCSTGISGWKPKTDSKQSASAADAGKEEAIMIVERDIRASQAMTREPSVLVVDDELSIRRLLGTILNGCGYRATLAADGAEARTAIETEQIALILCDIYLRGESGLALVQDLLRRSPRTVVLMMSGEGAPNQTCGTLDEGISGFIAKPFAAKDVTHRIAQALCGRCLGGMPVYGKNTFPWQRRREFTNA